MGTTTRTGGRGSSRLQGTPAGCGIGVGHDTGANADLALSTTRPFIIYRSLPSWTFLDGQGHGTGSIFHLAVSPVSLLLLERGMSLFIDLCRLAFVAGR